MDDPGMSGNWEEMFAGHLREKQAGPLTCPICAQTNSFTPKGTIGGHMADDVTRPEFQFGYAACDNCGYSIFFDASVTGLWFEHLVGERPSPVTEEEKPTGIHATAAGDAARSRGTVDFEGRKARVLRLNIRPGLGDRHSVLLVLDLGDARVELSGYFRNGMLIETSRKYVD